MHPIKKLLFIGFLLTVSLQTAGQTLHPYFNKAEYKELLLISVRTNSKKAYYSKFPAPEKFKKIYRSKVMGLDNLWELWINPASTIAVISLRGTTRETESWLANFYAAMIPAKGKLYLSDTETFAYELAPDPKAAVHIGWLIGMAFLSRDIVPKIDSLYQHGTKNFLLMGHSQGGAIDYLLTAYLYHLQQTGKLPKDIRFKTYCSASPKPGNLYFAYYYENLTKNGWGFNVVNSADWVPETPITIQTLNDFNPTNPFTHAQSEIKKLKFPENLVLKHIYNQLNKPTQKAQKNYEKYLGEKTSKIIMKNLKGFRPPPQYFNSNNYVRTGTTVVLYAGKKYYQRFPNETGNMFTHHMIDAYLYLLDGTKIPRKAAR